MRVQHERVETGRWLLRTHLWVPPGLVAGMVRIAGTRAGRVVVGPLARPRLQDVAHTARKAGPSRSVRFGRSSSRCASPNRRELEAPCM